MPPPPTGSSVGALERFGRIDTLVNNAGVYISKPFTEYTADDYAAVVGVNVTGFFTLTQRVIVEMLKRGAGHIVNITTTLADYANSSAPSVLTSLTKGGLASATKSLAIEYASRGIRVNAVSPRHHPDTCASGGELRRTRRTAPSNRARGSGPRHRRRHPFPGIVAVHHRRGPAHRRRPDRRPLMRSPTRFPGRQWLRPLRLHRDDRELGAGGGVAAPLRFVATRSDTFRLSST